MRFDITKPTPDRHDRARMGAFLSIGRGAFFHSSRRGVLRRLEARSRPSISWAARDVGERSLVKAEAAGGGGRSRRRRRPKASLYKGSLTDDHRLARSRGRGDVRLPLFSSTRVGGPSKRVVHSQPRRLRCRRHETAPHAHRFEWVRSGPGTRATDRRGGGVRRPGPSGRAEDRPRARFRPGEVWISRRS